MKPQIFLPILLGLLALALGLSSWSTHAYWPDADGYAASVANGRWVAHPPGYLFFVATGRLAHLVVSDPHQALEMISFSAWLLSIPAMFLALHRLTDFGPALGLSTAFGLGWIPLVISHSGTSHAVDLLLITLLLGVCSQPAFAAGKKIPALHFWLLLLIIAGFRLTTLIMLLPLVLLVLWQQRRSRAHWLGAGILGLAVAGLYLLTVHLSGGWTTYSAYASSEAATNRPSSLVLNGLTGPVLVNLSRSLFWFLSAAGLVFLPALARLAGWCRTTGNPAPLLFLASVLGPLGVTTFYLATHPGYLAPALPGVFFLAAMTWRDSNLQRIGLGLSLLLSLGWFWGLRVIRQPHGKRDATLNALVLQYSRDGVRHGIFQTLSGWLVEAGESGSVPSQRLDSLRHDQEQKIPSR